MSKADAIKLTLAEFEKEMTGNREAATSKFKDKTIELNGVVENVIPGFDGNGVVVSLIAPNRPVGSFFSCQCFLSDSKLFGKIGVGQTMRVRGTFFIGMLKPCEVLEMGPETLVRITSVELAKNHTANSEKTAEQYNKKTLVVTGEVVAVKPYPKLDSVFYIELKGDGKTVVECRFSNADEAKKAKVGVTITVLGPIATTEKNVINLALCYPVRK